MVSTLLLLAMLEVLPQQASDLQLTNIHSRHGLHGPKRTDNTIHVGDVFNLEWDIKGLKTGADGKAHYSIGIEIMNEKGMTVFTQVPKESVAILSLGGDQARAFFSSTIGLKTNPGKYTVKVTVNDLEAKKKISFRRDFKVVKPAFGIVRLYCSYDNEGTLPAPAIGVIGQTLQLNFHVMGAKTDAKGNPNLEVSIQALQNGKPVLGKPASTVITRGIKGEDLIPVHSGLTLNRSGKFTIEVTVKDKSSGKTTKESFPLVVYDEE